MEIAFHATQKQAKIFVLGATGFIGSALVKRLVRIGFTNIWALYRSENKKKEIYQDTDTASINFIQGDISSLATLSPALDQAAIVINATGLTTDWGPRSDYWKINVEAPQALIHLLNEKQTATQFIHISTAAVYGFSNSSKDENSTWIKSDRLYTASKVDMLKWLRKVRPELVVPTTIIFPPLIWGPGDQTFMPTFRDRLDSGQFLFWGKQKPIDFIHIDDLVDGILLCFFNPLAYHQEFILNGPVRFSLKAFVEKIAEYSNLPLPKISIPVSAALAIAGVMEGTARLINLFQPGFRPLLTRFQVLLLAEPLKLSDVHARQNLGYSPKIDFDAGNPSLEASIYTSKLVGIDTKYK